MLKTYIDLHIYFFCNWLLLLKIMLQFIHVDAYVDKIHSFFHGLIVFHCSVTS